jgi:TM2 domain-containing membrane protein YozV
LGLHRFYVGHRNTATAMLILSVSVVGLPVSLVWSIVDLFLIAGYVSHYNNELADKIEEHYYRMEVKRGQELQ